MTTSSNDAARSARQEDQELTDIAQITPGHTEKARELINENSPSSLLTVFEAAADAAYHAQTVETFTLHQQEKTVQLQQAHDKAEREKHERTWLDDMSAEYQKAYGQLMATVDKADKQYDRMRERLIERGKTLDDEGREIDGRAVHLADGDRAYRNSEGVLVDKDGVPLKGKAADEAKTLAQQRNDNVVGFGMYQQNAQARVGNDRLLQQVDAEQNNADTFKQNTMDGKNKDTAAVEAGARAIQEQATRTEASFEATVSKDAAPKVTQASFSDLADDTPATQPTADRTSFAKAVNPAAGISANDLSATFQAVAPGTNANPALPAPASKPVIGGSAPAIP
jgi:hypothetical protein